ncbi:putative nucleotidyltransferase substrate binding domain-containing protein [Polaromonas sp. DSR2-3-2]|uniref:putative nucleotidyltransferase substrate binding domain-containing protein n=1 Tax=unclassified Polaromonas TaxID=2638319 RepID=UPI003CF3D2A4
MPDDSSEPFSFNAPPFDCLSPEQQALVRGNLSRVSFPKGDVILTPDMEPAHVYVLVKGHVQQMEAGEVVAVYGPPDFFAFRAVMAGRASGVLQALDEVEAWQLPGATARALISGNALFSALVFADLSQRLSAAAENRKSREFLSLMMVRVKDAYIRKPFFVDGGLDLVSVCRLLSAQGLGNALVRDTKDGVERIGMFTTTDLRDALLRPEPPQQLAVREVAQFTLVSVQADAELSEALLAMIRHRVHRVLVREGDAILGVLSQLDLMSFVSNHSHLIALQVEQAASIAELRTAALQMDGLIALLHSGGARIELISSLVSELNGQIFARLWSFVAPAELVANSCLIVMGSEGRGEQILKTDQDNALLLRDGYAGAELQQSVQRFNQALTEFGYPPCPGNIMVTNPRWCQPLAGFQDSILGWLYGADADGPMNLAIFMDARAVAGDAALLRQARDYAHHIMAGSDAFFARFAAAIDQFSEPGGWWARLATLRGREEQVFDLKKLGTFPIVHGVRSLALEHRLDEVGTAARLQVLVSRRHIPSDLARDLIDALHFLMGVKLRSNLRQKQLEQPLDNLSHFSSLGTLDRDLLKDSLAIIKRFRLFLQLRYKLAT